MRLVGEAGTDGATLAIWDPEALPHDFDASYRSEALELLQALQTEGRLFWSETGADGSYLLHLYVDEPIPETLAGYSLDPIEVPRLRVPSGHLWFAGAEYVYREDNAFLTAHPHMGSCLELPPGVYEARFYRMEYPEEYVGDEISRRLGADDERLRGRAGCLVMTAALLSLAAVIALFLSRMSSGSLVLAAVAALLWVAVAMFVRTARYREVARRATEVECEYPSLLGELRTCSAE